MGSVCLIVTASDHSQVITNYWPGHAFEYVIKINLKKRLRGASTMMGCPDDERFENKR
jgi:hypothetical protein